MKVKTEKRRFTRSKFEDIFHLSPQQSLFLTKKKLNGVNVPNVHLDELEEILSAVDMSATDKALEVFAWGVRGQFLYENAIQGMII